MKEYGLVLDNATRSYLGYNPPRILSKLNTYISTVNTRREIMADRYRTSPGTESAGIRLLRKILADAEVGLVLDYESDYDRYTKILIYIQERLDRIFDPVTTGRTNTGLFIHKCRSEYIIPVKCIDYFSELPFDEGWEAWSKVTPLRLIDHDSRELSFNTYQDFIVFKEDIPKRAVFTIDTVALVLQYSRYLSTHTEGVLLSVPEYLHRYVICDSILEDLQNIWLRNVYLSILRDPTVIDTMRDASNSKVGQDIMYGYLGAQYPTAMAEIADLVDLCKVDSLKPSTLIGSLRLAEGYLPEYYTKLVDVTDIRDLRQSYWVEYLRDLPYIEIVLRSYALRPNYGPTKTLVFAMIRDISLLINTRFWSSISDTPTKLYIEDDIREKLAFLRSIPVK